MLGRNTKSLLLILAVLALFATDVMAQTGPRVNVMPEYWTWIGRTTTVWGNVSWGDSPTGTFTIYFGDGDDYSDSVGDSHFISATHTYAQTADVLARLIVVDDNGLSDEKQVRIHIGANAAEMAGGRSFAHWAALEDGLRWLYLNQAGDGSWSAYTDRRTAGTATALLAFEEHGHRASNSYDSDIYAEYVQKGLDYLFAQAVSDGNGVRFNPQYLYEHGMCMMAIVETLTPDDSVRVGPLTDWTYRRVIEGCVDYCEFGQNGNGGWRYTANYGSSDNSVGQWPALGLQAAEQVWGIVEDTGVKDLYLNWLAYSQNASSGGFGYDGPNNVVEPAMTAGGLNGLDYCGVPSDDPDYQRGLDYLCTQWETVGGRYGNFSNFYAMFGIAKALWLANPPVQSFCNDEPWWPDYVEWLLANQQADGRWVGNWDWRHDVLDTGWAVVILNGGIIYPVACIESQDVVPICVPFPVDGRCSFHPAEDQGRRIVTYQWDWDASDGIDWESPDDTEPYVPDVIYCEAGSYTITLRVIDDVGLDDTEQWQVVVEPDPCTNVPPIAVAGGPYSGRPGDTIVLDGSGSWDPNPIDPCGDYVAEWHWDRDGNGIYDDEEPVCANDQPLCELTLPEFESSWTIALKVCDTFEVCSDSSQARVTVIVGERDVSITDDDVWSVPRYADAGEPVMLHARVHCDPTSESGVDGLVVRFYKDHPDSGGYQIGTDQAVPYLPVGGSELVSMEWTVPDTLPHQIYAFADPEQLILEFNEDNNIGHTEVNPECVLASTGDVDNVGGDLSVPILVTDLTGRDVTSADMIFTFDPEVMRGTGAHFEGSVVEGTDWGFMWNDPSPGEVRVAMAGTESLLGEGTLVTLEFEVLDMARCGACTPLELGLVFNEGVPCVEIPDTASYCLPMDWVQGLVRYYGCAQLGNTRPPIPDVLMSLMGSPPDTTRTDENGLFLVDACEDSCYTLNAMKEGGEQEGISTLDAALILRYMVALEELADCPIEPMEMYGGGFCPEVDVLAQQIAAEVTGNGAISSYDASVILKYIVGQDMSEFRVGDWTFYCDEREICPLEASTDGQDFVGVLYGDVSGNWHGEFAGIRSTASVLVGSAVGEPGQSADVPVSLEGADGFYGLEFRVEHDAQMAVVGDVSVTGMGVGCLLEWTAVPGEVHIAIAGAGGFSGDGEICQITYEILPEPEVPWTILACKEPRADEQQVFLDSVDGSLELEASSVQDLSLAGPFAILGVRPNPTSLGTVIEFRLPGSTNVDAAIYGVSGRLIRTLSSRTMTGGVHRLDWDGRDETGNQVGAGIYYCRVKAGREEETIPLTVVR